MAYALAGQPAPQFDLETVTTGRRLTNAGTAGRPLVLVFVGQSTARFATGVGTALRKSHPTPADAGLAAIVDLRSVPGFARGIAEGRLAQAYENAALLAPTGADPAEYVLIVADWTGDVCRDFAIDDPNTEAIAVVIGADGAIVGAAPADDPAAVCALVG